MTTSGDPHLLQDDLRSQVLRSSTETVELVALDVLLREAEVRDLDVAIGVEEEILRLQISVDDALAVEVVETQSYFSCIETSTVF